MNNIENEIMHLQSELSHLSPQAVAVYSACCGERLVGFYDAFCEKAAWGDPSRLRLALNRIWDFLSQKDMSLVDLKATLRDVEHLTPNAGIFDIVETTPAQDVCICVDSAIRWLLGTEIDFPHAVIYSFEALRVLICVQETGCIDLGDTKENEKFERELLLNPLIVKEIRMQKEDLNDLKSCDVITAEIVGCLRVRSESNRLNARNILCQVLKPCPTEDDEPK